jgi:tetratricopeptide (TPR) repeat protein
VITHKIPLQQRVFSYALISLWFIPACVIAAPLEDISLTAETGRVVAMIKLSSPVSNVRYTPAKKGATLSILLDKLPSGLTIDEWQDNEVLTSPPSSLIPSFTVRTNLKNIQPKLIIEFSREAEYTVNMGRDARSIVIGIKIDREVPRFDGSLPLLPDVAPLAANATEIDKKAAAFMLSGRNSLAVGDNFAAIDAFNKLLLLPPNNYTQDGQEWVGVARERAGQLDKAKLELELYLKLYNNPEDAKRIKLRLASLGSKPPKSASVTAESAKGKKAFSQTLSYGSLSMHYYHGASKIDTVDSATPFSNALSQSSFSAVDQSALLTTVVATQRYISETYDNRLVFQDTAYTNFLPDQEGKNRLGAAYFELKNKISDYSIRLGRQSSNGAGVLGRFDGVTAGAGITPSIRVNAVAGQLSDISLGPKPVFFGTSVDMGTVTLYAISQKADGMVERQAVGTEMRYFDPSKSAFLLLDYDTLFSELNVAMLQSTYSATPERIYSLFIDHRRTPYLTTRNALYGALTTSLTDLLLFMTEEQIRVLAGARTGTSNMAQLGLTQQVSSNWQVGGDVRVSRFAAMPASGTPIDIFADPNAPPPIEGYLPEQASSGNDWAISQQLTGSNLYSTRDITVFNLSLMTSPTYKGQSFYIYSRGNFTDKWSMDLSLQLYRQKFESGMLMTRIMPMLRTAYQIRKSVSLDMDTGYEVTRTEMGTQTTDGKRQFFSLGFRWDF